MRKLFYSLLCCLTAGSLLTVSAAHAAPAQKSGGNASEEKTAEKLPDAVENPVFTPSLRSDVSPDSYEDEQRAEDLMDQRRNLILKMHQTRKYIISNDAEARAEYEKMMEAAERLTVIVENKKAMRALNKQLKDLDDELAKLPMKQNVSENPETAVDSNGRSETEVSSSSAREKEDTDLRRTARNSNSSVRSSR